MRLLREILTDTVEETAGRAAVACRITLDELRGDGITRAEIEAVLGELGEIPDLWDFAMGTWPDDSVTSRFGSEGGQEQYVTGLKALTSKPVVGVGRFTAPGTIAAAVWEGRRFAEEIENPSDDTDTTPYRREVTQLAPRA